MSAEAAESDGVARGSRNYDNHEAYNIVDSLLKEGKLEAKS
jgi:hypothetical protein